MTQRSVTDEKEPTVQYQTNKIYWTSPKSFMKRSIAPKYRRIEMKNNMAPRDDRIIPKLIKSRGKLLLKNYL